jgi:hypothetical protein
MYSYIIFKKNVVIFFKVVQLIIGINAWLILPNKYGLDN